MNKTSKLISLLIFGMLSCQDAQKIREREAAANDSLMLKEAPDAPGVKKDSANQFMVAAPDLMQKKYVKIIKYYTTEPNSAGGVSCDIIWKNISNQTIKYIIFTVTPYNAVEDPVESEIGRESTRSVRGTGPFKPGKTYGYGTEWDNLWYNSTIKKMKIESVDVEFMN